MVRFIQLGTWFAPIVVAATYGDFFAYRLGTTTLLHIEWNVFRFSNTNSPFLDDIST
jgi:hypothetical protein